MKSNAQAIPTKAGQEPAANPFHATPPSAQHCGNAQAPPHLSKARRNIGGYLVLLPPGICGIRGKGSKDAKIQSEIACDHNRTQPGDAPQPLHIDEPESHPAQKADPKSCAPFLFGLGRPQQGKQNPHPAPNQPPLIKRWKAKCEEHATPYRQRWSKEFFHQPILSWASFSSQVQRLPRDDSTASRESPFPKR